LRRTLMVVIPLITVGGVLLWKSWPASLGQERVPPPLQYSAVMRNDVYMGVGSCASPACHGGPVSAHQDRVWNSSYTVWVNQDKHAGAYSVLFGPRSLQIFRNYKHLPETASCQPYEEPACLACHATVRSVPQDDRGLLSDGIGCESCHGPARGWLADHASCSWNRQIRDPHATDAFGDGDMVATKDLAVRAGVCVDCHVGSAGGNGLPARNMDHDMIAAGHPRLTFEFTAFMANMPRHWSDRDEASAEGNSPRVWAIGQAASMQAALRLLAYRAASAEKAAAAEPHSAPWPELSEYDCYACHHGLKLQSYDPKRFAAAGSGGSAASAKPGRLPWGTWYMPTTCLLLQHGLDTPEAVSDIREIAELMSEPSPPPGVVRERARAAAEKMQQCVDAAKIAQYDRRRLESLVRAATNLQPANWDEACGIFLLLRSSYGSDPRVAPSLAEFLKLLRFKGDNDSPRDFNPAAFDHHMSEFRKLLFP